MKDRTFLIMWGLSLILVGSLLFTLVINYRISVENNTLLKMIVKYHHLEGNEKLKQNLLGEQ